MCFSKLYLSPLWIQSQDAKMISNHGFKYLELYEEMARQASDQGQPLFLYNAKIHMICHILRNLSWEAELANVALNPMVWGVQLEEDLVGKASRLVRHVSSTPYYASKRSLQRWLIAAHRAWVKSEMITRCD